MKNIIKRIIINVLCTIVIFVVWYMLYTHHRIALDILIDMLGAWYLGRLIGKFVDWLCDNKETK